MRNTITFFFPQNKPGFNTCILLQLTFANLPLAPCKLALFPLLFVTLALPGWSQCPTGKVEFYTQYDVDNFKVFYPGCTVIEGDLWIDSKPNILNLDSLHEIKTVRGDLRIAYNDSLQNLDGLRNLDSLGGYLAVFGNPELVSIAGLSKLTKVPGEFNLGECPNLSSLAGLENLTEVEGPFYLELSSMTSDLSALSNLQRLASLYVTGTPGLDDFSVFSSLSKLENLSIYTNSALVSLNGLQGIDTLGGVTITNASSLVSLKGLENIRHLGGLTITQCDNLPALDSLKQMNSCGPIHLNQNAALSNLAGLSGLKSVAALELYNMPSLSTLSGLDNLENIGGLVGIQNLPVLNSISAFQKIRRVHESFGLFDLPSLASLDGLHNLDTVNHDLRLYNMPQVLDLNPLSKLKKVGNNLEIIGFSALSDISGLEGLQEVGTIYLSGNSSLSNCAVTGVCKKFKTRPDQVLLSANAPGCNDASELAAQCTTFPVMARVAVDADGDCLENPGLNLPAADAAVLIASNVGSDLKPCDANGEVHFEVFEKQPLTLSVQRISFQNWEVCLDNQVLDPTNLPPGDTLRAKFLLRPIRNCAELEMRLALPDAFPVSAASHEVSVSVRNIGFPAASSVTTAVVLPFSGFDFVASIPPPVSQSGDTLFFDLGDIAPFTTGTLRLEIQAKNTALDRSFCWEAFADASNTCTVAAQTGSEIRLSAECAGDSVLFTLKNIGDAATQNPHEYRIVQNQFTNSVHPFNLNPQETLQVKVPANGAAWRLEATRRDDGSRTATAIEACGGFRPGQISDFWFEDRGANHDSGCRQITAAPVLNDYPFITAVPGGGEFDNYIAPGEAIRYTLHMQNHSADTLHQVALYSSIDSKLDLASFQPVAASHPFQWSIKNGNQLEIIVPNADLPPISTNPLQAQAFLTYEMRLKTGVATGLENRLNVVYDQSFPLASVYNHIIGDPPQRVFSCAPQGVNISSQWDADFFSRYYNGCIHIEGQLQIQGFDLENLKGLSEVESAAWVTISNCQPLQNLDGLSNLKSTGGMWINGNPDLNSLSGLDRLETIDNQLGISFHPKLDTIDGFEKLKKIGGTFEISLNPGLRAIKGFEMLDSMGTFYVLENNGLNEISGFNKLQEVKSDFFINRQPIASFSGFSKLERVGGSFTLNEIGVKTLENLERLSHVGGNFQLSDLYLLDTLRRLNRLEKVGGSFRLINNTYLNSMADFENLKSVGGNFEITQIPSIYTFSQFENLDSIGGDFLFLQNHACGDLAGFADLRDVGIVKIEDCNSLQNVSGFNQLQAMDGLELTQNPELLQVGGFTALDSIRHYLIVQHNPMLLDLAGLNNLKSIGISAYFLRNRVIQLDHFGNLRHIGSRLDVEDNLFLNNLDGFPLLDSLGQLNVLNNYSLASMNGFSQLKKLNNDIFIKKNNALQTIEGFENLVLAGGSIRVDSNVNLLKIESFQNLKTIGLDLFWQSNPQLKSISGFSALESIGRDFSCFDHALLDSIAEFPKLQNIGRDLAFAANGILTDPLCLSHLRQVGGTAWLGPYNGFTQLQGLDSLKTIGKNLRIYLNFFLEDIAGLNHLESVGCDFEMEVNLILKEITGLNKLKTVGGTFFMNHLPMFQSLGTLTAMESIGGKLILNKTGIYNLFPFNNLQSIGTGVVLYQNYALNDISALQGIELSTDDTLYIKENYNLSECSIASVCQYLDASPTYVTIEDNKTGCSSVNEINAKCSSTPVKVRVMLDLDSDCQPGAGDEALGEVQVHLEGNFLKTTKPSDSSGVVHFNYFENGGFALTLPQFPTAVWKPCTAVIQLVPGPQQMDTLYADFLLQPQITCPQLETTLTMPSNFRSCLTTTDVRVLTENTGSVLAENAVCSVVLPSVLEIVQTIPVASGTQGDTIFFNFGDLNPFEKAPVLLRVKTRCDTFLFGHTLCLEAFSSLDNSCPTTGVSASEIKIRAACLGDTLLRFTLENIGDAPTLAPHTYRIFRNASSGPPQAFSLAAHQSLDIDVAADGATYRIEATKRDDGALTAAALENCGGLTPGWISAFWLDEAGPEYDFDCRQVIGSYDPNLKSVAPTGAGPDHRLPSNQPLVYTIDFQNTGTDTAFRVLLRDVLSKKLDLTTFRPMASSHPCTWEILEENRLEVLFSPIALPDSNVNEPASHGYFTFEIYQLPDLPFNTLIENTASIIFDYNPPIITNTVFHTIGELTVRVDEPLHKKVLWDVLGNPTNDKAVFQAKEPIDGVKHFELHDAVGRLCRVAQFSGQSFEFHRDGLPSGLYLFSIRDEFGRVFAGKVVVVE
jgi:Receptor L domain